MPYVWAGIFVAWTVAYGRYQGKKGQRMMAAAAAVQGPGTSDADPQPGRHHQDRRPGMIPKMPGVSRMGSPVAARDRLG
jgi:hypothetical protein